MKKYLKYIYITFFALFSFYYANKVVELSKYNDTIMVSINEYASKHDYKCKEGSINENGIILGYTGLVVNKNKSYSNMKGIGFKEELIEFEENKCILNKEDNLDKYILKGNEEENNVSILLNIDNTKYYKKMLSISESKNIELNLLFNVNNLRNEIDNIENHSNILFKGSTKEELNDFISLLHNEFFCVTYDKDNLDICKNKKLNTIKLTNIIEKDLLINTKNILSSGTIIFINETESNQSELSSTINYIKSRGYSIVSINKLLN